MRNSLKSVIESHLLPYVQRPMRYAGRELNSVIKDLSTVSVHGVICFPDLYDIGMSHTGLQILYHIVNSNTQWALSRAFHPWNDAEGVMRKQQIPLYSLEYFLPIAQADFIGFTVQYELQYTNILNMIDLAGIHPLRSERSTQEPIILAGGPCVGNPEPLADFIDAFVIGDGEQVITTIAETIETAKRTGDTKYQILKRLAGIKGIYIPALYETMEKHLFTVPVSLSDSYPIQPARVATLDDAFYPKKPLVPLIEVTHKRLAVEIMRGCTRGCRFCSAGMYYRPVRERKPSAIAQQVEDGVNTTGWDEIGLLSLSTADYTALSPLLDRLEEIKGEGYISCSLPSTRVDALNDEQLDQLNRVSSLSSFTIAPEAGSERLRRVINKGFSDEVIFAAVDTLIKKKVQTLKLYFMLGLPTEQDDDIEAIIFLSGEIARKMRVSSKRRMVHISLSPFSPKPHTPFQRECMDDPEILRRKGRHIKKSLSGLKNIKVTYRNPEQTVLETAMARGDRHIGRVVYSAWKRGARFDGWDEWFNFKRWNDAALECSVDLKKYCTTIPIYEPLPWHVISSGVTESFLSDERKQAYSETLTEDCRTGRCTHCGACSSTIQTLLSPTIPLPFNKWSNQSSIAQGKRRSEAGQCRYRYRFHYKKNDIIRFLGHLDMAAVIYRAIRLAGLPIVYSNGFNPHPRIAFGPPLPFTVDGWYEAFDVVMSDEITFHSYEVNRFLPEGITVVDCMKIGLKEPALNASIFFGRYRFSVVDADDRICIEKKIRSALASDSIPITVKKKGVMVDKDIRKGIIECSIPDETGMWHAVLCIHGKNTCKPLELLKVVVPDARYVRSISRCECYNCEYKKV